MKHLPLVVLSLTLLSALAVLIVGTRLARVEETVVIDESRVPATAFTARFLKEVEEAKERLRLRGVEQHHPSHHGGRMQLPRVLEHEDVLIRRDEGRQQMLEQLLLKLSL